VLHRLSIQRKQSLPESQPREPQRMDHLSQPSQGIHDIKEDRMLWMTVPCLPRNSRKGEARQVDHFSHPLGAQACTIKEEDPWTLAGHHLPCPARVQWRHMACHLEQGIQATRVGNKHTI